MAFFQGSNSSYLSLSLRPTDGRRAVVFRLSRSKIELAQKFLPAALVIASCGLLGIGLLGLLPQLGVKIDDKVRTIGILALAGFSGATAFAEIMFFLRIRAGNDRLSDTELKAMPPPRLFRRLSLLAYVSFLMALSAPFLGLGALPGGLTDFSSELFVSDRLSFFLIMQVVIFGMLLSAVLLWRIYLIAVWKPERGNN